MLYEVHICAGRINLFSYNNVFYSLTVFSLLCVSGSWGFGGYGRYDIIGMHPTGTMLQSKPNVLHITACLLLRLGHREQKDEWQPRLVEVFQKQNVLPPNAIVSAGSASSACTAGMAQ